MRERKERKKRKKQKKKGKAFFKNSSEKKTEEEEKKKKNQMPLANKEVVHLKHGWEKIQVVHPTFTAYLYLSCCSR
jgi:hypothetical protein